MVFDIVEPRIPNPQYVFFREINYSGSYDAWALFEMLRDAFPSAYITLECFNGYENCVAVAKL